MAVDDVLTTGKAEVQNRVRAVAQEQLDTHRCGVALVAVSPQSDSPPGEAGAATAPVPSPQPLPARPPGER